MKDKLKEKIPMVIGVLAIAPFILAVVFFLVLFVVLVIQKLWTCSPILGILGIIYIFIVILAVAFDVLGKYE